MDILVIGVGYVGLVSGACFAEMGHNVTCLDINSHKIQQLKLGIIPIHEPGLEEIVKRNYKSNRLHFTTDYPSALQNSRVCFLAVDTPTLPDGSADTTNIEKVAETLALHMQHHTVVVTKSTVPVGTTLKLSAIISAGLKERNIEIPFDVVSNPEFLKEGNAIQDFMKPDRIVIGVNNPDVIPLMKEIYSSFMLNHERLLVMDIASAELAKYAANAMLAARISFMNEMARLCEKIGADIDCIRKVIGSDHRIGPNFLYAGVGYGGSCLPKDVKALQAQAKHLECSMLLMQAIDKVNTDQKKIMGQKIFNYFLAKEASASPLKGKVIGILGLAFKPDTDDMREASSLILIQDLLSQGAILRLFDPIAAEKAKALLPDNPAIYWCQNELETAQQADAIVLMTEWKQFRFMNFETLLSEMKGNVFFDGRNQYSPEQMIQRGFDYVCMGKPQSDAQASQITLKPYLEMEIPY